MRPIAITFLVMISISARNARADLKTDIEYGKAGDVSLKLDAATPDDGAGPFPIAIIVHGGGWHGGDKADLAFLYKPLNENHFVCFSINYRLTPTYRWPACFDDVQTAIRWTKAHAKEYKADPNRIVMFGHSAGGQLVCMAGMVTDPETRVQGVVAMAPVTDFEFGLEARGGLSANFQNLLDRPLQVTEESRRLLRGVSPINHIKPGLCPYLLLHGSADTNVGHQQTVNFFNKLNEARIDAEMITVNGGTHAVTGWDAADPTWKPKMIEWLEKRYDAAKP